MIITYLRSSSYGTHCMCEQQYFLEYVLGYKSPSNKKADKGTICHKILEILAHIKLCQQNNTNSYVDDILGPINVNKYDLDEIIDSVYSYYSSQFKHHVWEPKDLKDCRAWSHKALIDHNGIFDPRSRNIVRPEQHFDIEIDKPWANYEFDTKDGIIKGKLAIKGTIDLITKVNDHIIMSINFINDGGAFSMCYDKKDLSSTENLIRQKFEEIKKCKQPRLSKTWKCNKLCYFGKNNFSQTNKDILPIIEYRDNETCKRGSEMTICEQIKHDIDLKGIKTVVDEYTFPGYSVGKYKAPGSTE